jgi:UDP-GlcNAc:undecaprenyl-phosphate GlcNAc-1-phosphate transferase
MLSLCLAMVPVAMAVSLPVCLLALRLSRRLGLTDAGTVPGRERFGSRRVPNTGGIGVFAGIALPLGAAVTLAAIWPDRLAGLLPGFAEHLPGLAGSAPLALLFLGCIALLHVVGLVDDRRPLGPWIKLAAIALPCLAVPFLTTILPSLSPTRLLTLVDGHAGGAWLSILLTAAWLIVVTNALNMMDNMDGLCGGVTVASGCAFLAAAIVNGQWFVAAALALLVGSVLGFLVFNLPPARLYMGDAGSLVVGFTLGFLTVRATYYDPGRAAEAGGWFAVFMPLVVLAVPLYDLASVVAIRVRLGLSPLAGDTRHLSHRLVRLGLSQRAAVLVIVALSAATGITGIFLGALDGWLAALAAAQTLLILVVVALLEIAAARASARAREARVPHGTPPPAPGERSRA